MEAHCTGWVFSEMPASTAVVAPMASVSVHPCVGSAGGGSHTAASTATASAPSARA